MFRVLTKRGTIFLVVVALACFALEREQRLLQKTQPSELLQEEVRHQSSTNVMEELIERRATMKSTNERDGNPVLRGGGGRSSRRVSNDAVIIDGGDDDAIDERSVADKRNDKVFLANRSRNNSTMIQSDLTKATASTDPTLPQIAWLVSFPNSGTSYTMTLVERASNLSTASNYAAEVTAPGVPALPVLPFSGSEQGTGPYWEGNVSAAVLERTLRPLPTTFVLTKTHCGGRCVNCGADEYVVNTTSFLSACLRTTTRERRKGKKKSKGGRNLFRQVERYMNPIHVKRIVHLIRNPLHNVVARFHLEHRHFVQKEPSLNVTYPRNATGFARWCDHIDQTYDHFYRPSEGDLVDANSSSNNNTIMSVDRRLVKLSDDFDHSQVLCRGELFKYVQWHERVLAMVPVIEAFQSQAGTKEKGLAIDEGPSVPVLTIHYEDYHGKFNETVEELMAFVEQNITANLRPFRALPLYDRDHFTGRQRDAIKEYIKVIATPRVWKLLERYFE